MVKYNEKLRYNKKILDNTHLYDNIKKNSKNKKNILVGGNFFSDLAFGWQLLIILICIVIIYKSLVHYFLNLK